MPAPWSHLNPGHTSTLVTLAHTHSAAVANWHCLKLAHHLPSIVQSHSSLATALVKNGGTTASAGRAVRLPPLLHSEGLLPLLPQAADEHGTAWHGGSKHSTAQHKSRSQHNMAQEGPVQRSTVLHSAASINKQHAVQEQVCT